MKKQNKRKSGQRTALRVLCVMLSVILVLLIALTVYLESLLGMINRSEGSEFLSASEYQEYLNSQKETQPSNYTGPVIDPTDVTWATQGQLIEKGENIINIMLIGQDRREGQGRSHADVMILCTINKDKKTLTMTSFMRDMYVQIPGYSDDRINVAYFLGGMELQEACLQKNFGVQVDGNVEVDFYGFMKVIDLLGGVDIELSQAEADYLNRRGNWDVEENTHWNLKAGVNHLTGSQALAYSRIRYVGNDDFERTSRQRTVLEALLKSVKNLKISQINSLLVEILPHLTTDLTNAEMVGYVLDLFPLLSDLKIVNQRIPADGTYQPATIRGMMVLVPDLEANRKLLEDAIGN